jgi:hypothetical protein
MGKIAKLKDTQLEFREVEKNSSHGKEMRTGCQSSYRDAIGQKLFSLGEGTGIIW